MLFFSADQSCTYEHLSENGNDFVGRLLHEVGFRRIFQLKRFILSGIAGIGSDHRGAQGNPI
jgi:hypothetical protein